MESLRRPELFIGVIVLAALVFFADLIIPTEATITVLYVAPVLLTLFQPERKIIIFIAAGCTFLTLISFLLSSGNETRIVNLVISIIGIWIAVYFIIKFKVQAYDESKNKERLKALFEFATEGMIIAGSKGEIVMINPMAEKQFGYQKGELEGKKIELLIPARMAERHVKHREDYVKDPYPRPMGKGRLLYGRRKDDSEFPVEISLSNFATGKESYVIAFIIDISERRNSEELLSKEKELAQMYLDIAPVIFLVLEKDQTVSLINQNGCNILGFPEEDIVEKNWFDDFVSGNEKESSRELFIKLMDGKIDVSSPFDYAIVTASGEKRLITWKNALISDDNGIPVAMLCSGEDITARKQQEELIDRANGELKRYSDEILGMNADLEKRVQIRTEELGELIHKLEQMNSDLAVEIKERKQAESLLQKNREDLRLALDKEKELSELKSRFVTMASHEFRTPLSTILSSVSLISKYNEPGQDEKRFKHIERIKSAVYNLTSILNDFLSLGKLEEGKVVSSPTTFDITSFSNDLIGELKEVTKIGQTINYTHNGSGTTVFLDKNLTRNICINLLSNAIKYSEEATQIRFHTSIENDTLMMEVTDQGIGIPESEQQYIFDRFFRANNASNIQGTGLGLNIVKKYVELMNGEVLFRSRPGNGTTFSVTLPLHIPVL